MPGLHPHADRLEHLASETSRKKSCFVNQALKEYFKALDDYEIALKRRGGAATPITRTITPHTFPHSVATQMLRNHADSCHIQAILGHARITSTELYARVSLEGLKERDAAGASAREEGLTPRFGFCIVCIYTLYGVGYGNTTDRQDR